MTRLLQGAGIRALERVVFDAGTVATLPEADWLMTCVASDGAITETPGDVNVRPYMACYGALGLIRAFEVTSYQPYADAAKAWCVWYASHMNATTGYVNDYTMTAGFSDNFDRSDGSVANGWSLWYGSTANISGGHVVGDSDGAAIWRDFGLADYDLTFDVNATGSLRFEAYLGTLADVSASQTYYLLTLTSDGTLTFWRRTTGSGDVSLASATLSAAPTGVTLRIVKTGDQLVCYYGLSALTATITTPCSGTGIGLLVANSVVLDNVVLAQARVDSGAADSTDAYAGMFAVTALKVWLATHADDAGWIDTVNAAAPGGNALLLALTAITSTQQEDGLTWALPTYTVKYLEDNLEALAGLSALDTLALFTSNADVSAAIATPEIAMGPGVGLLWNYETRTYDYALHEDNAFTPNDWSDENSRRQQAWALAWGADPPGSGDSDALMDGYLAALPGWSTQTSSYEVLPAWALRRLGRTAAADAGVADLEASAASSSHAYPWTCATSGQLIMAKYDLGQLAFAYPVFPDGVNLMPNPDFADDSNSDGAADYVLNYGSPTMTLLSDPDAAAPAHVQQMVDPGGLDMHWDPIDVTPGHFYVLSCYRKITALDSGNLGVLTFKRYQSDGTYIDYGYTPTVADALDSDFVRWYIVIWADDTVGKIQPIISAGNPGAMTIQVKAIKLEQAGCSPTPFVYPTHV